MSGPGEVGWIGFQPKVKQGERILLSQIPSYEWDAVVDALKSKSQKTRSGELVFQLSDYQSWKSKQKK